VVGDPVEGVGKPCLRIDAVQFGGFNQGIDDGCGFAATFRSDEHVIFATYGDAAHGPFGCLIVEFKEPVIQISAQALHAGESITNGVGQGGLARQLGQFAYRGLCCPCIGLWAAFASRVWWSEMILTGVRQDYLDVSRLDGRQNTSLIKES
jgi:hypothetical protein